VVAAAAGQVQRGECCSVEVSCCNSKGTVV
jgi:hypothetical protein